MHRPTRGQLGAQLAHELLELGVNKIAQPLFPAFTEVHVQRSVFDPHLYNWFFVHLHFPKRLVNPVLPHMLPPVWPLRGQHVFQNEGK